MIDRLKEAFNDELKKLFKPDDVVRIQGCLILAEQKQAKIIASNLLVRSDFKNEDEKLKIASAEFVDACNKLCAAIRAIKLLPLT